MRTCSQTDTLTDRHAHIYTCTCTCATGAAGAGRGHRRPPKRKGVRRVSCRYPRDHAAAEDRGTELLRRPIQLPGDHRACVLVCVCVSVLPPVLPPSSLPHSLTLTLSLSLCTVRHVPMSTCPCPAAARARWPARAPPRTCRWARRDWAPRAACWPPRASPSSTMRRVSLERRLIELGSEEGRVMGRGQCLILPSMLECSIMPWLPSFLPSCVLLMLMFTSSPDCSCFRHRLRQRRQCGLANFPPVLRAGRHRVYVPRLRRWESHSLTHTQTRTHTHTSCLSVCLPTFLPICLAAGCHIFPFPPTLLLVPFPPTLLLILLLPWQHTSTY